MDADTVYDLETMRDVAALTAELENVVGESKGIREVAVKAERFTERTKIIEFIETMREDGDFDLDNLIEGLVNGLHRDDLDD